MMVRILSLLLSDGSDWDDISQVIICKPMKESNEQFAWHQTPNSWNVAVSCTQTKTLLIPDELFFSSFFNCLHGKMNGARKTLLIDTKSL